MHLESIIIYIKCPIGSAHARVIGALCVNVEVQSCLVCPCRTLTGALGPCRSLEKTLIFGQRTRSHCTWTSAFLRESYKPALLLHGTAGGMETGRCPRLEGPHWFFLTGAQKMRCLFPPWMAGPRWQPRINAPPRPLNWCLSTRWNEQLRLRRNCILSPRCYATIWRWRCTATDFSHRSFGEGATPTEKAGSIFSDVICTFMFWCSKYPQMSESPSSRNERWWWGRRA